VKSKYAATAKRYAKEIASGKRVAGEFVKLACARYLKDLGRSEIYFDEAAADRRCWWAETHYHIKGAWAQRNEHIKLEAWEVWILCAIFGFKRHKGGPRRFNEAYIRVARKNGKSVIGALIGLSMFVDDEEFGAEVYSGATSEKQAWEVFGPARLMAKRNEEFAKHYGIDVNAKNLNCAADNSKFEPVIGNPGDGASPHCAIIDEFHEHSTWSQYSTFKNGMGAREQPLLLIITTAGSNIASPCFEKDDEIKKILQGVQRGDDVFGVIYAADPEDDWTSVTAMKKANPNLGISVSRHYLDSLLEGARRTPSAEAAYKTKNLNQWVASGKAFLNTLQWAACGDARLQLEDFEGKDCIFGVDLASRVDVVALMRVFYEPGPDGNMIYTWFPRFWLPENRLADDPTGQYAAFFANGFVETHSEDEIDFAALRNSIKEEADRFSPTEIAFDPWRAAGLEQELSNEGFTMVKIPQTIAQFTDPMNELQAAVFSQRLRHPNNAMLNWMAANLVAKEDTNGNKKPRREIARNKIDGMIAGLMAMNRAMAQGSGGNVTGRLRVV